MLEILLKHEFDDLIGNLQRRFREFFTFRITRYFGASCTVIALIAYSGHFMERHDSENSVVTDTLPVFSNIPQPVDRAAPFERSTFPKPPDLSTPKNGDAAIAQTERLGIVPQIAVDQRVLDDTTGLIAIPIAMTE